MSKVSRVKPRDDIRAYELTVDERDAGQGTFQYTFHGRLVAEATAATALDDVVAETQLYERHSSPGLGGEKKGFIDFVGYSTVVVRNAEEARFRRVCNGDSFAMILCGLARFDAAEAFFRFHSAAPAAPATQKRPRPESIYHSFREGVWLIDCVEKVRRCYRDALMRLVRQYHDDLSAAVPRMARHRHREP
jgi:hypothetical protein